MGSFAMAANPGFFNSGGNSGAGSNQYFNNVPSMFNPWSGSGGGSGGGNPSGGGGGGYFNNQQPMAEGNNPYMPMPNGGSSGVPPYGLSSYGASGPQWLGTPGHSSNIGHGIIATGLQYPGLSGDMATYLQSQIGQGLSPFGESIPLPTGGMTQPGQLTAGMNPLLSQLANFFQTGQGGGMPGMNTLSTIANQGISALPEWQSMIAAMGQNTAQNQANLKEQFAGMGNLAGSPFATGMSNYMQQTNLDQNALLGQLQQQNILQGQIPVAQGLMQGGTQMASGLQNLDQSAIQAYLQQFQMDQPQNNPLISSIMGMSTLYPPTTRTPSTWENLNSTIGALTGSGFSTGGGSQGGQTSVNF